MNEIITGDDKRYEKEQGKVQVIKRVSMGILDWGMADYDMYYPAKRYYADKRV